jgi:hypothetical protein
MRHKPMTHIVAFFCRVKFSLVFSARIGRLKPGTEIADT